MVDVIELVSGVEESVMVEESVLVVVEFFFKLNVCP